MTRIRRKPDRDLSPGSESAHRVITEMIFHVAVAGHQLRHVILPELGEDDLERFAQKIRKHIEPAAMRHTHANFVNAAFRALMQNRIKNYHERFGALKAALTKFAWVW